MSIRLGGTWRELPRSPFSAANATAVWAGDRMVVINHRRGRTATYYPLTGRWEEHQRVPGKSPAGGTFDGAPDAVWTGDEVIVFGGRTGRDSDWVTWYAFDPARGRWRDVPASPLEQRGLATAWTGDLLLVVGRDRTAAAYDPAADCWLEMPDLPLPELPDNARTWRAMEWEVRSLHWTGDELLAEVSAEQQRVPIGIVSFDPRAWTWDPGPQAPSSSRLSSPILAGGRLWFMFEDALDDYIVDATYDPGLKLWEAVDIDCPISSWGTVWTGRLIMEPMWNRHAYDPTTGECFRTPRVKDRARTSGGTVWTGREFIVWSGAWGDSGRAFPDGLVYRPPRSAIDAERSEPFSKKLQRAIRTRREFGFDADPGVVREIMADPDESASSKYGFPMTSREYGEILARGWFISQTRSLRAYLKKLPIFGGLWLDPGVRGPIVIALTEADREVLTEIDALIPTEPDLGWRLVIVPTPLRDLKRAYWRAVAVSRRIDPTATIAVVSLDRSDGLIEYRYTPDSVKRMRARKKQLEKELGVPVRILVGHPPVDT